MLQRSECQLLRSSGTRSSTIRFVDSIARGCSGTKSVIIRTKPGAREALRKSLAAQGRRVKGEFPALDAITADVSCADLKALAGFRETASVSDNATVHGHQLGDRPAAEAIARRQRCGRHRRQAVGVLVKSANRIIRRSRRRA